MDFGGGFAVGLAVGMGAGIATGASSGQSGARNRIRDYVEQNGFTIHDRYGAPVKVDDFLDDACGECGTSCCASKRTALVIIGAGLAVLAAAAIAVYLIRSGVFQ